jgi:hypothetical protein
MNATTNRDYFLIQHLLLDFFLMEAHCVLCEVRTHIISTNFGLIRVEHFKLKFMHDGRLVYNGNFN